MSKPTTVHVALHPRVLADPRVEFLDPPPHIFPDERARITREDKAVCVRYIGPARNTVDRLVRRQELTLVPAPLAAKPSKE